MEERLYECEENVEAFRPGSVIAGFRRSRNLGEIIAPTRPRRERRVRGEGGSFPCAAPRACLLHQSGALQVVARVTSRWDNSVFLLKRRTTCSTPSTIYRIHCPCTNPTDYVGSAKNGMSKRWYKHKSDLRLKKWAACGLAKHFGRHHQANMEEAISSLEVTLLDHLPGPFDEDRLLLLEQEWMHKLGTTQPGVGCNSRLELTTRQRRNWGNQ